MSNNINKINYQKSKATLFLKPYSKPTLKEQGTLNELTQGFIGSSPDGEGGHSKNSPFQG